MFKKKLAIFALALALSTGTAVSAFADTTNKVAIENCGAYLFEWRPVDCGDGVAFAILVGAMSPAFLKLIRSFTHASHNGSCPNTLLPAFTPVMIS